MPSALRLQAGIDKPKTKPLRRKAQGLFSVTAEFSGSNGSPIEEQQDKRDNQNQSQSTRRIVAPAGAVRPSGQTSNQEQYQNDHQYCTHRMSSLVGLNPLTVRAFLIPIVSCERGRERIAPPNGPPLAHLEPERENDDLR